MNSASGSQDIPVNIDPNAWTVVLRNGVPTLVPRQQPQPFQLVPQQPARLELEAPPNQVGQPALPVLDKATYENALALHYASQPGALNAHQYGFLKTRLKNLREELDKYDHLVDQRLVSDSSQDNPPRNVQGGQTEYMNAEGSRNNQTIPAMSRQNHASDQLRALEAIHATRREALARELAQQSSRQQGSLRDMRAQPQRPTAEALNRQPTQQFNQPSTSGGNAPSTSMPPYANVPSAPRPAAYVQFNQQDLSRHQAYLQELQAINASHARTNGMTGPNVVPGSINRPSSGAPQMVRQPAQTQSGQRRQQPAPPVGTSQQPKYQFVVQPPSNVSLPAQPQPGVPNIPVQSNQGVVNTNRSHSSVTGQPLQTAVHTSNMRPMVVPQVTAPYAAPNLIIPLPQVSNSSAETHARISPVPSPERNTLPAANPAAPNPGQPVRIHPHSTAGTKTAPTQISVTGPSLTSKSVDKPMQNVPQQRTSLQHPVDGSSRTGPAPVASTSQSRQPVISIPGAGASSSSTGKFSLAQAIRAVYEDPSGNTVLPPIIEPARKKRAGTPKSSQKHTPSPIPLPLPTQQASETPTSAELKASTDTKPVEADQELVQISNGTSREPSTDEPIDVSTFFENSELTPSNHTPEEDHRVTLTEITPQTTANIPQSEEPKEKTVIPQSVTPRQGSIIDLDKSSSPASVDLQAELVVEETEKTPTPRKRKRSSQLLFLPLSPTVERATPVIKPAEPVTIFYPPPRRRFLGVQVPVIDPDPIVYGYLRDNMKESRSSDSDTTHEGGGRDHHKKAKSRPPPLSAEDAARLTQRTCEWSSCRATLKNLQTLRHHLETVHVAGAVKSQNFQCRWRYCYKPTFDDEDELLDHLVAHAESKIFCMHADCDFVTLDYPKLKSHIASAHNGDMSSLKPIASTVWFTPPQPDQLLPAIATVAEAVFLPVRGHPGARIPSRTPSPIQSSQPIPTILLSPTKQSREDSEEPKDQYSFLSPFYKPSLEFEESSIEPLDQFLQECDLLYDGQGDTTAVQRGTSVGTSDIDELNF